MPAIHPSIAPRPGRDAPIVSLYLCGDGSQQDTRRRLIEVVSVLLDASRPMQRMAIRNALDHMSAALDSLYIPPGSGIALFAETTGTGRVWWAPVPSLIPTQVHLGSTPRTLAGLGLDDLVLAEAAA